MDTERLPFIHEKAEVQTESIGNGTLVWQYSIILEDAKIGKCCNINAHVFIEGDVIVGDNVTIKCGVQLWDGITIENNAFIGPNVTFTNDKYPRSKKYPSRFLKTLVKKGASIGANATILSGIVIGENAIVGAGSVVTKDVPPKAIVKGNPAYISGYVDSSTFKKADLPNRDLDKISTEIQSSKVKGVKIHRMPTITDIRGSLSFAEYGQFLPFIVKRYFLVYDVPNREVRGEHAHKELHQFLVCVKGSCSVVVDDGFTREEVSLNHPSVGLHVPPMVWGVQYKYSSDAVLLVFASELYDKDDYIRNYEDFIAKVRGK